MIELQVVVLDSSFVLHYLQTSSAGFDRILLGHQREMLFVAVLLMLRNQRSLLKKQSKPRLSLMDKG